MCFFNENCSFSNEKTANLKRIRISRFYFSNIENYIIVVVQHIDILNTTTLKWKIMLLQHKS